MMFLRTDKVSAWPDDYGLTEDDYDFIYRQNFFRLTNLETENFDNTLFGEKLWRRKNLNE